MTTSAVLLAHLAVTCFLAGLIWVVQLVHYPLFGAVERSGFAAFEAEHSKRITWIVAPSMALEAVLGVSLLLLPAAEVARGPAWLGLGLLAVVWGSTAFVQVPCHQRLGAGYDAAVHRRLVRTNWLRTAAWTARALLAAQLVAARLAG